jgi:hypothetical protein
MTRKDFELIARVIKNSDEVADDMTREAIASIFTAELVATNPNFDRARFLKACGVN